MSFEATTQGYARLHMLQALRKETDGRLSDRLLVAAIEAQGHRKSLDYVRTQLHALKELGAVTLPIDNEATIVAELTVAGREHCERRRIIAGVHRPDPGE